MKVKSVKKIPPEKSHCISVGSSNKLFTVGEKGTLLTHNSVAQQNIIFSCILRPEHWVLLGIDLKRVELTRFKDFGVSVAADLDVAVDFLRFAQAVMMKRYSRMEDAGVNDFKDLPVPGQALLVMIDEAGELLSPSGSKALSENTPIKTIHGYKTIKDVNIGDIIFDKNNEETKITNKYEPGAQKHFNLTISSDSSHKKENIISGAEHLWVVRIEEPNGSLSNERIMNTQELQDFIIKEKKLSKKDRSKVKIKRYK